MTSKPLDILKKGLEVLKREVHSRKTKLEACLRQKEKLSIEDEEWLDHEGNTVDAEMVCDMLEAASDYERGIEGLDNMGRGLVLKLRELSGEAKKITSQKRKSMSSSLTIDVSFMQ